MAGYCFALCPPSRGSLFAYATSAISAATSIAAWLDEPMQIFFFAVANLVFAGIEYLILRYLWYQTPAGDRRWGTRWIVTIALTAGCAGGVAAVVATLAYRWLCSN
jgi:hypothetical protein